MTEFKIPKKLIEVALPLDAINKAAAHEKSIRHGHPNTLHLWWARRPLAAARAAVFAQLVNDPGYERSLNRGLNKEKAHAERERLFRIIERLVLWENTNNESVLEEAREEIWKSWRETCALNKDHPRAQELFNPEILPALHDPFAGGGTIPLEARRLGLETYASDLNPVAATINTAMIVIPPKFVSVAPVGPVTNGNSKSALFEDWSNSNGLVEDVRRYGNWIREEALKKIGDYYPKITVTKAMTKGRHDLVPFIGQELTTIAWIWARTVKSPNPAFAHLEIPLVASFSLSKKTGKEVWVKPEIKKDGSGFDFVVQVGGAPTIEQTVTRSGGKCILSGAPVDFPYIRSEGKAGRLGQRLMAVALQGPKGRIYLSPEPWMEELANRAVPIDPPETLLPDRALGFRVQEYGMTKHSDLFTSRQLLLLTTLSQLINDVNPIIREAARNAKMVDDGISLESGGSGATAYADAICTYLALFVSRQANYSSTLCVWSSHPKDELAKQVFMRHALAMTWDFAETNPFSDSGGSLSTNLSFLIKAIPRIKPGSPSRAFVADAGFVDMKNHIIVTDPPYFDNVGYADLSDFFYIWLRRGLVSRFPEMFSFPLTPKKEELIASPFRHASPAGAEDFFLEGMRKVMKRVAEQSHPAFPSSIFYAFKQSETDDDQGTSNTGWHTFLQAVCDSGFRIVGTWPMRTELVGNLKKKVNALASSVVLVCRQRSKDAKAISRRDFIRELNQELPQALDEMTNGGVNSPVAPVDLSQAIIGPGMAIFSKYSAVLEADGKPMSVRAALQIINRFFAEDDFDHDTQFCIQWFSQHGWDSGAFGEADVLARAKGTSVDGLRDGGVVFGSGGSVNLLKPVELDSNWKPESDERVSVWEVLHHMIARFNHDGEDGAGEILSRVGNFAETVRTLAYRLYTVCERKGWASDAGHYDSLVRAWDSIESAARSIGYAGTQVSLFGDELAESRPNSTTKKKTRKKS